MTRHLGNLRTLGVLPCGECRAYVPRDGGCEHFRLADASYPRVRRERAPEDPTRFDHQYGVIRLASSTTMLRVLCTAIVLGEVLPVGQQERKRANSLMRAGMLAREKIGHPFRPTDAGRELYAKVLAHLNEGR